MISRRLHLHHDGGEGQAFLCGCWIEENHFVLVLVVQKQDVFDFQAFDSLGPNGCVEEGKRVKLSAEFRRLALLMKVTLYNPLIVYLCPTSFFEEMFGRAKCSGTFTWNLMPAGSQKHLQHNNSDCALFVVHYALGAVVGYMIFIFVLTSIVFHLCLWWW